MKKPIEALTDSELQELNRRYIACLEDFERSLNALAEKARAELLALGYNSAEDVSRSLRFLASKAVGLREAPFGRGTLYYASALTVPKE